MNSDFLHVRINVVCSLRARLIHETRDRSGNSLLNVSSHRALHTEKTHVLVHLSSWTRTYVCDLNFVYRVLDKGHKSCVGQLLWSVHEPIWIHYVHKIESEGSVRPHHSTLCKKVFGKVPQL